MLTSDERAELERYGPRRQRPSGSCAPRPRPAAPGRPPFVRGGDRRRRLEFGDDRQVEGRLPGDSLRGLWGGHQGWRPTVLPPAVAARVLAWTRKTPPHGANHWSTRTLFTRLNISHTMVARIWKRPGLQPHRLERYMLSTDPDFETKATDVIRLYLQPPQHAVVFCVDEKTAIQAMNRRDPILPLSPGQAERHGFEYARHGTLSLYAALNTDTGEVIGKTAARTPTRDVSPSSARS